MLVRVLCFWSAVAAGPDDDDDDNDDDNCDSDDADDKDLIGMATLVYAAIVAACVVART